MWDRQVAAFTPHFRVIRYDTRGFGQSLTDDVEFSNRRDLDDLLDHLSVRTAHLLGVSRGGQIAMDFTLERPRRVSALVMVASGPGGFESPQPPPAHETQIFAEMEAAWEQKDFERLTDLETQMWVDGPGQPSTRVASAVRERIRAMILNNYRTHTIEGKPIPLAPPAAGRLAEISVPTLVVVGDLDTSHIRAAAARMEHGIRGAQKVVLPGTAHMLSLERPEEFDRVVLEFLRGVASGPARRPSSA